MYLQVFFKKNTSRKFLILLLFYLPLFWMQISTECHDLSYVHVQPSWYTTLFWISFRGVVLRCIGLAQKMSARWKRASDTSFYVLSFYFPFFFFSILFLALSHVSFFFNSLRFGSRLWKVNIYQNSNLFYHYFFQRTPVLYNFISQSNVFLFVIYFHYNNIHGKITQFWLVKINAVFR